MILIFIFAAGLLGLALVTWGIYAYFHKPVYGGYEGYPRAEVTVKGHAVTAVIADTMARQNQGLSDRPSMPQDEGMLFRFPMPMRYSFWMKEMRFPLDLIWIRNDAIVDVSKDVPAPPPGASMFSLPTYSPSVAVDTVLEVNAGTADRYGWQAGDAVQVREMK